MDVSFYLNLNYQYVIVVNKDLFYCLVPKIIHTSPLEILSQRVTKDLNDSMSPNWNFERVGRWGQIDQTKEPSLKECA